MVNDEIENGEDGGSDGPDGVQGPQVQKDNGLHVDGMLWSVQVHALLVAYGLILGEEAADKCPEGPTLCIPQKEQGL